MRRTPLSVRWWWGILTFLMYLLIRAKPQVFGPFNPADWRVPPPLLSYFFKGGVLIRSRFAGAATHVSSCFVARQRRKMDWNWLGCFFWGDMRVARVAAFQREAVWAGSVLTLHHAGSGVDASISDSCSAPGYGGQTLTVGQVGVVSADLLSTCPESSAP